MFNSFVHRACVFTAALVGLAACASAAPPRAVGQDAPQAPLALADGGDFRIAGASGDVVVLAFFTTYCPSSPATLRALDRIRTSNADGGLRVVAVDEGDTSAQVEVWTGRHGVRLPIAFDKDHAAANELGLVTVPSIVVIDRQGTVRHVHAGYHGDDDRSSIEGEVAALLHTQIASRD